MLKKIDLALIGFMGYTLYSLSLTNEKMSFMELKNDSSFESYSQNRKKWIAKLHPDANAPEKSVEEFEKAQDLDKLFNTSGKFRRHSMELFVFGEIDENSLSKFKSAFRKMTQAIITISVICVAIFSKLTTVRLQSTAFLALAVFLFPLFYIFYWQYLFVFEGRADFFAVLRVFLSRCSLNQWFMQATVNELIDLILAIVLFGVAALIYILPSDVQPNRDYARLFSNLINQLKTESGEKKQPNFELLRSTITTIDEAMPKESVAWRRIQKVFNLISIGLLLYSVVFNR